MTYTRTILTAITLALATILIAAYAASQPRLPKRYEDQQSLTIYQVMVASFNRDTTATTPGYTAMWGPDDNRKDGNIAGVTAALDHIASIGANAIWLTPIFDSSKAKGGEKLRSTGYFANDYFAIDPHFGTPDDLRHLIDEAHARGLYVILDGVFGHHGGVTTPSPSGYTIDSTPSANVRDTIPSGNVAYPASLPYFREVATWWIDNYDIDGWRLDQAYQVVQNGHNYWREIRQAVQDLADHRAAQGKRWGTLAYMVGEDWGDANAINAGVYSDHGLISAFDFDGKERISGPMQDIESEGLDNWDDIIYVLSTPRQRGYKDDTVLPNLFVTNHDGYRLADHLNPAEPLYIEKQMTRMAILAAYNGPITLYYGDEFGDRAVDNHGWQKDNVSRTSGHIVPLDDQQRQLMQYTSNVMNLRRQNPAMWRGIPTFHHHNIDGADVLIVDKTDIKTGNRVAIVFSDKNVSVPIEGTYIDVDAWRPEIKVLTPSHVKHHNK